MEHGRMLGRKKRKGRHVSYEICSELPGFNLGMEQILDLAKALTELKELNPRQARIVELRFIDGLTMEEVAGALRLSLRTVEADWFIARDCH